MEPTDLDDLVEIMELATRDVAETVDGLDLDEIVTLHARADAWRRILSGLVRDLRAEIVLMIDRPVIVGQQMYEPTRKLKLAVSAGAAMDLVTAKASRMLVDPETGDNVRALVVDDIASVMTVRSAPARLRDRFDVPVEYVNDLRIGG